MDLVELANICNFSYTPSGVFQDYKVNIVNKNNASMCVLENDSMVIVCFRGTDDIKDVFQDINIIKRSFYSTNGLFFGYVPGGFLNYYNELKEDLFNIVSAVKNKKVILTGHSLGCSSVYGALDLRMNLPGSNIEFYGFACPKMGCDYFNNMCSKYLTCRTTAIDNIKDIITKLPPGYSYMPNILYIGEKSRYSFVKSIRERLTLFLTKTPVVTQQFIKEHSILTYINLLRNKLIKIASQIY